VDCAGIGSGDLTLILAALFERLQSHMLPDGLSRFYLLGSAPQLRGPLDAAKAQPLFHLVQCVRTTVLPVYPDDPDILWHHQAGNGPDLQSGRGALLEGNSTDGAQSVPLSGRGG